MKLSESGRRLGYTCWLVVWTVLGAHASSGVWSGAADAYWTNSANWSASPYPAGGDTATFSGGSANTSVDINGLADILNITFDTASVAAYTLGAGGANSQTNVLRDGGEIKLTSTAGNGSSFNSTVRLGPDTTTAGYSFRNDNAGQALTFSDVAGMSGGTKSLNVNGVGPVVVNGKLDRSSSALDLYYNSTGALALNGNASVRLVQINATNGVINLGAGTTMTVNNSGGSGLMSAENCTINGPGVMTLSTSGGNNHLDNGAANGKTLTINAKLTGATGFEYWHGSYYGTIALMNAANDYTMSTIINVPATIKFDSLANGLTPCGLGSGTNIILNHASCRYLYVGSGSVSDRLVDLQAGGIIEQAGTGNLKFTRATGATAGSKTLTLQGSTSGTGEFSGGIMNSGGTVSLVKTGTGIWTISGASSYSGSTLVQGGSLVLSGTSGSIVSSASYTVTNGATLRLYNTASAANADRLGNAKGVTMQGGTLSFDHDGGAANFSESVGALSVQLNANTVSVTQATEGQTCILTFASLARTGSGTVDFVGTGLGESARARILITGQPAGILGTWVTINGGGLAAYDPVKGVYDASASAVSIAARGPDSVIPDNASAGAVIDSDGVSGAITLAGEWTNSILYVSQATATPAVIATSDGVTNKTLLTSGLSIGAGKAGLTLGAAAGDGVLSPLVAAGTVVLQNDSSDAWLTVNASVRNNGAASGIAKQGAGPVLLTASNSYSGATALYEGALVVGGSVTQALSGAISGEGSLIKKDSGYLVLTSANTFTGPMVISNGTVLVKNNAALGTSASGTQITDGGTLDIGGSTSGQAMNLDAEQITVSGAGVNGRGAIINGSAVSQYNALRIVSLSGDAAFGGDNSNGRWDIRNVNGTATLALNGHTLTKVGANLFGLTGVAVTPGAGSVDVQEGGFTAEVGTTMGGNASNTMTIRGGAYFDAYSIYSPIVWSLVMDSGARFYSRNGNSTNQSIWAGPVTLNGNALMDNAASTCFSIRGDISGASGNVIKTGSGTTYFTGANNTYGGITAVSNGTLYVLHPGSLPGYDEGRVTVSAGKTLAIYASNGTVGWTPEAVRDLHAHTSFLAVDAQLAIDTGFSGMDYGYAFTNLMGLTKLNNHTLTLSGKVAHKGDVRVYGGELVLNGAGDHEVRTVIVGNAHLYLTNAVAMHVDVTNCSAYIGNGSGDFGRMTVGGNSSWAGYLYPYNTNQTTLVIGNSGRGVLTIQDNASVTQKLYVGNAAGSHGAVYQRGGVMHNWGGASSDPRIGMTGYGYYELNSGTFTNNGYTQLGRDFSGVGILKQYGGAFKMGSIYGGQLGVSRGGTGVVYTAGGTFNTSTGINLGEASDNSTRNGFAVFTTDGDALVNINGTVNMADRTNMVAMLNLNGGTLAANIISKSASRTGALALVNFDGGAILSRQNGKVFNTGTSAPDAVNIFAGGAVFDTSNYVCTVDVPLLAPAGNGVSAIGIAPRGGYIGPPMVTLTGGEGTGATAIAEFDSGSGTVTGITVTSPGYGYTGAPTVSLSGGGTNVHNAAVASIAANASGGLVKLGSGMLSLTATNTYQGATVVSNGVLAITTQAALAPNTDLVLAGGLLNLGGFTMTNDTITLYSGTLANGHVYGDSVVKAGNGDATLAANVNVSSVRVDQGVLRLQGSTPGLYEAPVNGAFNTTEEMSTGIVVRLTTRMANMAYTEPYNVTWIYKGFLWNRAETNVTWTFVENFDDAVKLLIDGNQVLYNTTWNQPSTNNYTLVPGAHAFEARFGQGTGGGGPPTDANAGWFATGQTIGFGYDPLGRGEAVVGNYQPMVDPSDGSLFTLTAAGNTTNQIGEGASAEIAAGAMLDLDGHYQAFGSLSGAGAVSNGILAVTGVLAPGGVGTVGALTLACDALLPGTLLIDLAAGGVCDQLLVRGNLTLQESSVLQIANPELLDQSKIYTVIASSGAGQVSGTFGSLDIPDGRWHLSYPSDGSVKLIYTRGTTVLIQ